MYSAAAPSDGRSFPQRRTVADNELPLAVLDSLKPHDRLRTPPPPSARKATALYRRLRPFVLGVAGLGFLVALAGCATGLSAESGAPPLTLSTAPDTVRVRVLYTNSPARLTCVGGYRFGLRMGGKTYLAHESTRVRAMRNRMVFGHQGFKGEVVVTPANSTDALSLNGRRYRGSLVFHPLRNGRYDVVEYLTLQEYLYGVLPREVDPAWPLDALKAQAIVSRSYAVYSKSAAARERF